MASAAHLSPREPPNDLEVYGRYALGEEIASGGMAKVHLGLLRAPGAATRVVAIKRLHAQYAADAEFAAMFADEARLASRVRHPNVVSAHEIVVERAARSLGAGRHADGELAIVMEYVHGEALGRLLGRAAETGTRLPPAVAVSILLDVLSGLHAAHEATDERGEPLGVVHRDVSPQNVIVGVDGVARILDFGIAKAAGRLHTTKEGSVKGKLGYMAPEQLRSEADRRSDVYGSGVCLWEALVGRRLFRGDNESAVLAKVLAGLVDPPSAQVAGLAAALDAVALKAIARAPEERFATAREMALALEAALPAASPEEVGAWVERLAPAPLAKRKEAIARLEREEARSEEARSEERKALSEDVKSLAELATRPARALSSSPPPAVARDASLRPRAPRVATSAALGIGLLVTTAIAVTAARARDVGGASRQGDSVPASVASPLSVSSASEPRVSDSPVFGSQLSEPGVSGADGPGMDPPVSELAVRGSSVSDPSVPAPNVTGATPRHASNAHRPRKSAPTPRGSATPLAAVAPSAAAFTSAASAPPAPPSSTACALPWWVDADGVRHYKKECFERR